MMSLTFRTSLGLLVAAALCPACELALGDIPDKASPVVAVGGMAGDLATGTAGGTSSTTTSDASNAGTGGDLGSGGNLGAGGETSAAGGTSGAGGISGLGGSIGTAGSSAGGSRNGGAGGSGGAAGAGGKAGSSGGGASGNGGSGPGDASPEGAPRDAGSDADPCDVDGDGYRSRSCGGNDCDDNALLVHPGQLNYSVDPTHVGGTDFDFDCNGLPQPQFTSINCAGLGLTCNQSGSGFLGMMAPACGQSGSFGHCIVNGLNCDPQVEQTSKKMPCR